jgi:UPF0755 protein
MARRERKHRNGPLIIAGALTILLIVAVVAGGALWLLRPASGQTVQVTVKPGATSTEIASDLAGAGVVNNALLFRLYVKDQGAQDKLQAGAYKMRTGMSYADALALLLKGPFFKYYKVTIPEGLTVADIAAQVARQTPIKKDSFLAAAVNNGYDFPFLKGLKTDGLEGYLFPKTYTISDRTTARDLVTLMLQQFGKETRSLDLKEIKAKGYLLGDAIIVASIVEVEAKLDQDRPLVAAVVYNRLAQGMMLQLDSTVEFALPARKPELSFKDLEISSPYNTYQHEGLPPGPIAAPGLKSIQAALHPAPVGYLYFAVTGTDGSITFTNTYDEFSKLNIVQGQ